MKIHPSLKTVGDAWKVTEKYGLGSLPSGLVFEIATALLNAEQVNTDMLELLKDYAATWKDAHPDGECARPSLCLVCRAKEIIQKAEGRGIAWH